jgi:hypothetical protein
MPNEDQYMDRTPDLVAKIRKLREAAEKEMNYFTRVADYDVRRVVGEKPKALAFPEETASPSQAEEQPKMPAAVRAIVRLPVQSSPAPAERGDDGEDQ